MPEHLHMPGPLLSGEDYINSLRGRDLNLYLMGERVEEPADHPIIRPSINAVAETYELAAREPELATALSPFTGERINRFLHIAQSTEDLVAQIKMQRKLGQLTGTCFQRCVGMDAINALYSTTYEMDEAHGTTYHERLKTFITAVQKKNCIICGAMTDPKGDRSKAPHEQDDPDLYLRIVERRDDGIVIKGAKAHQTGGINSHWIIVMPTVRLGVEDKDYAVVGALPVTAPGITYIYGRQPGENRSSEIHDIDVGNRNFAGQEVLVIFDNVFIPWELVFMDGEFDFAAMLVSRFTTYHRKSYVCKSGVGDVLIGAAATVADYNGVPKASHIRDKLVEMTHLNETIYATGLAASTQGHPTKSGNWQSDDMLGNVCKHHVTRLPWVLARIAQDLAGGLVATLPSGQDLKDTELGPVLEKYLKGRKDISTEDRWKILRLIENMTMGRNAVGYLTESIHGAGSPQAQRVQIARLMQLEHKKSLAKKLAGITDDQGIDQDDSYFKRVFDKDAKE
jgi:4-hydroxybutyryl-CoA dehydratase/vinylacetyl-CoA-Delta-isomerase